MSWKGILRRAGVNITGPDGANDWNFEGVVNARNVVTRLAGSHFHVDSNHTNAFDASGYGMRKDKPFATIDYAVGKCAANNADVIWVHAGHVEAVVAVAGLDLDVEGITIIFLGNGDDQAKITFGTDVDADMDVDADNITLVNPRFESAIDALTGPIDVNKANFTIINGEYYDAAAKAATDCIVAVAAAKGLTIDGWKYFESTTGTQKESNIQLNGVDDLVLRNIDIRGDFDSSNIENITDECLNVRFEDIYLNNLAPGPVACMKLDADCDGFAINVNCRIASGTGYLSDNSDINWGPDCRGYSADGGSGEPLGTSLAGGIEGKIDIIDGLHDVPTKDAATDAFMRDVVGRKTDSAASGAVSEVESVMAYTKQAVTEGIARDGVIGALDTAAAAGAVTDADLIMAYIKQLVTAAIADAVQTLKLDGVTIATDPVAASLASFIASGGTTLGKQLPVSTSLVDLLGDFTGPHDGVALDDNIKAALDIIEGQTDDIGTAGAGLSDLGGMSTTMKGQIQTEIGTLVTKATGAISGAGDTNLFTVSTGLVEIISLTGEVTVQIGADQDHILKHGTTDLAALLLCDADAVGTLYGTTGNPGDALVEGNNAGLKGQVTPFIVNTGTIKLTVAGATFAGEITWKLRYRPIEAGASVTAA